MNHAGRDVESPQRERALWRRLLLGAISLVGFLTVAAVLAAIYCLLHLFGWGEQVGFLSGNLPRGDALKWPLIQGAVYIVAYFAFVLGVPILGLAAGIFSTLLRLQGGGKLERASTGRLGRER